MNNKFLVRGKDIHSNEWVKGSVVHRRGDVIAVELRNNNIKFYNVDPKTMGRFIGRKDKNNKNIFEGDIVKTKYGRLCAVRILNSPSFIGVDLVGLEQFHNVPDKFDLFKSENLEVVGNIYDNTVVDKIYDTPELLNK